MPEWGACPNGGLLTYATGRALARRWVVEKTFISTRLSAICSLFQGKIENKFMLLLHPIQNQDFIKINIKPLFVRWLCDRQPVTFYKSYYKSMIYNDL